jgi:hypothetical protein
VGLAALAGFDVCALGGPRLAAFPEATTTAWLQLTEQDLRLWTVPAAFADRGPATHIGGCRAVPSASAVT